jgi:hypothetical protein
VDKNAREYSSYGEQRPSLKEKLIKIGAKVVGHGRYVTFQMAGVAVWPQMFAEILLLHCPATSHTSSSTKTARGLWRRRQQRCASLKATQCGHAAPSTGSSERRLCAVGARFTVAEGIRNR